jgi:SAM-dependent methyltransferase
MHVSHTAVTEPKPSPVASTAAGWEKWHAFNARSMQPVTEWLCTAAAPQRGQRVLDVACGTGLPSLALAARVHPGGSVLATDSAPEMLESAARIARAADAHGLEHRVMSAQALEVPDASFDAVTCAFGLMFCPDPIAAVAELRRALRLGGRFAVAVWDEPSKCPFFTIPFGALAQVAPPPPAAPGSRGMFGLSPASELDAVLRKGGLTPSAIQSVSVHFELESVAQYLEIVGDMAAPMRAALTTLAAADLDRLRGLIAEASRPFTSSDGTLRVPATALCASGFC